MCYYVRQGIIDLMINLAEIKKLSPRRSINYEGANI